MKNHFSFLLIGIILFLSCERAAKVEPTIEDDFINVKISLTGDYVDLSSSPLSRSDNTSSDKTYYAFEIDSLHLLPVRPGQYEESYQHYAEGLFDQDHIQNLSVSLKKNHKFRIRCTIIKDQEDTLYVDGDNCVYEPFAAKAYGYGEKAHLHNLFIYDSNQTLWTNLHINNWSRVNKNVQVMYAKLDRYYGEAFTEGESVTISTERRNFGLHFLLTAPQEGALHVSNVYYPFPSFSFDLYPGDHSINEEHIYSLDPTNDFANIKLKVEWRKANNEIVDLSPEAFTVYNKNIMTIKVDVNDRIGNSDITINTSGNEMSYSELIIK